VIGEKRRVRNEKWFDDECRIATERKNADRLIMMQRERERRDRIMKDTKKAEAEQTKSCRERKGDI
jgi:hypothetical protein